MKDFIIIYTSYLLPALVIGYIADLIFGDPQGVWHPVRLIGNWITWFERGLRRVFFCDGRKAGFDKKTADAGNSDTDGSESGKYRDKCERKSQMREFLAGFCLVVLVLFCSTALPFALLFVCYRIHWILGAAMQSYMSYTILATKSLRVESMKVYTALKTEGLQAGRRTVSMIVGRDTAALDESGIVRAAVETVAENTSDGVIAPLIFLAIGGPVLGYFYKAVNTMDSMVGYKNEKYRHFGTAAARLDDVANYLPARISAILMIGAAFLFSLFGALLSGFRRDKQGLGEPEKSAARFRKTGRDSFRMNGRNAWKIWRRDRRRHASPNSAQTEAVMAGALGIQLAGDAWYFGVKHEKPTIGDALRPVEPEDIVRANRLMYVTSIVAAIIFLGVRPR
ncbi:MAG: cobalamin biosynthesis protein [Clostridiales bacterium]|nr:cobalamin biosynthesis protein [Clostridiales bacterium]